MNAWKNASAVFALSCVMLGAAQAQAQLSVVFRDPTGTVGPTDAIPIWLTLQNTGNQALSFSSMAGPTSLTGLPLPTAGFAAASNVAVTFASYTSLSPFISRGCSGDTFNLAPCVGGPYQYDVPSTPNQWFTQAASNFSLAAGASVDVLTYTLAPLGGTAAVGTYFTTSQGLGLRVRGLDQNGALLEANVFSATTCSNRDPACSFTRTVTAVPEPGTWAMMAVGIAVLVGRRRFLSNR